MKQTKKTKKDAPVAGLVREKSAGAVAAAVEGVDAVLGKRLVGAEKRADEVPGVLRPARRCISSCSSPFLPPRLNKHGPAKRLPAAGVEAGAGVPKMLPLRA